jgi:hypothetical protein
MPCPRVKVRAASRSRGPGYDDRLPGVPHLPALSFSRRAQLAFAAAGLHKVSSSNRDDVNFSSTTATTRSPHSRCDLGRLRRDQGIRT